MPFFHYFWAENKSFACCLRPSRQHFGVRDLHNLNVSAHGTMGANGVYGCAQQGLGVPGHMKSTCRPSRTPFFSLSRHLQWSTSTKVCTVTATPGPKRPDTHGGALGALWGFGGGQIHHFRHSESIFEGPRAPRGAIVEIPPTPTNASVCGKRAHKGPARRQNCHFPDHFWPFPGLYGLLEGRNWPQMGPTGSGNNFFFEKIFGQKLRFLPFFHHFWTPIWPPFPLKKRGFPKPARKFCDSPPRFMYDHRQRPTWIAPLEPEFSRNTQGLAPNTQTPRTFIGLKLGRFAIFAIFALPGNSTPPPLRLPPPPS